MHGPAPAPPPYRPQAPGTVVLLRVLFVAVAVLSLGFLAWATLLRAALVQRRPLGWWLFGADVALLGATIMWSGGYPETDWHTDAAVAVILLQMAGAVAYYLVVDLRAARTAGPAYGQLPGFGAAYGAGPAGYPAGGPAAGPAPHPYGPAPVPHHTPEPQPYGAPGGVPVNPYARTETRLSQPGGPAAPAHPAPPPAGPYAPPPDRPQPPQRIDRVRAELDELSDYLRKEEGR
ncbi:hypothetical protein [Streptomyces platensis]|uniref:hypothetical protein n=1 Tax=Streptomyces platensis TaxID=58346 RepID=UPI001F433313|nr:hypothetical protein [Streptomyces platensis]MCF3147059.1 hypothetical protein [Streptomyces platensis]